MFEDDLHSVIAFIFKNAKYLKTETSFNDLLFVYTILNKYLLIFIGICPYYDTYGKSIQRSEISCVSVDLTKNCTDVYSSADVYNCKLLKEI